MAVLASCRLLPCQDQQAERDVTAGAGECLSCVTLLPIFAVVLALAGVQEHRRFPRLAGRLRDGAGGQGMIAAESARAEAVSAVEGPIQDLLAVDRVVHEPARLVILAVLANAEEVDFSFLQTASGLTKGNLSRHAAKLEEAGYVDIRKYYKGKVPATGYRMTPVGRVAFTTYWERMCSIQQSVAAEKTAP
jgi:DNA-binding transcriptional ArsR family regulator